MNKEISERFKLMWANPEKREQIMEHRKGKYILTDEGRAKLRLSKLGNKSRTGMVNNPGMRKHISEGLIGNHCGVGNKSRTGQKRSKEECAKQSATMRGIKRSEQFKLNLKRQRQGSKNPAWLGGIAHAPYDCLFNQEMKELIRTRDNYVCQLCGMPEREMTKRLALHHIDYDKNNTLPSNVISLCNSCHAKVNTKREYWTEYFRNHLNQMQVNFNKLQKGLKIGYQSRLKEQNVLKGVRAV